MEINKTHINNFMYKSENHKKNIFVLNFLIDLLKSIKIIKVCRYFVVFFV